MYFELFSKGNLIIRGRKWIGTLDFDHELNLAPSVSMTLDGDWIPLIDGREEVKIHFDDGKVFWGIVWGFNIDKVSETITLDIRHVVTEWEYRQISVNHAQSNKALNIVYKGDSVEKSEANDESITASGFNVALKTAKKLTDAQIIERARASAWVTSNGDKVVITSVKIQKCTTEGEGEEEKEKCEDASMTEAETYKVTFATAKGTSVSVEVTVDEKSDPEFDPVDDPAVIDKLEDIYSDTNFAYPGWQIEFDGDAENQMIDYVYSRQNKLEALTQTMELTADYWWRVGWWNEKMLQIGRFGEEKPYIISTKPSGATNIRMIEEPQIEPDLENVINVATVYSDKSDGGMSSLTLREVYSDPSLQRDKFPVVILHSNVNNERDYRMYIEQYPKLAPNNEIEYAIIDEESVALESGTIIEGTYSFNDLSPFELDSETITDEKRIKAARTVYEAVIKKLIQARRSYNITIKTEHLPKDLLAGDKARLLYDNRLFVTDACSNYWKKLLSLDDWFYITRINYSIDENGIETAEVTLSKWLKIERETINTQG